MSWSVVFCDEFDAEFQEMAEGLQDEFLAHALLLREFGPNLGRPTVDTLKGGADQRRFYKRLIDIADERYGKHLALLAGSQAGGKDGKYGKKS